MTTGSLEPAPAFYERYPMMLPYKGRRFGEGLKPALLLIGESHYLPNGSTQHLDAQSWYQGCSATLSEEEREWINTGDILRTQLDKRFRDRAHVIWKNALIEINDHGPKYLDYRDLAAHVAVYNFFLRPALEGGSLKPHRLDIDFANDAFQMHYNILRPTAIVFLSVLAYNHLLRPETLAVPSIVTPHPGCRWWNKVARKYGNRRGRDLLADFAKTITWDL